MNLYLSGKLGVFVGEHTPTQKNIPLEVLKREAEKKGMEVVVNTSLFGKEKKIFSRDGALVRILKKGEAAIIKAGVKAYACVCFNPDEIIVRWSLKKIEGRVAIYAPRMEHASATTTGTTPLYEVLEEIVSDLFSTVFVELPEAVVEMPRVPWQTSLHFCGCGEGDTPLTLFRSEGEEQAMEVLKKLQELGLLE